MPDASILASIEPIIRDLFDRFEGELTPTLSARDVAQWDSLANVQFMVMVERAFRVRFTASEISALRNLGELEALVARKLPQIPAG